MPSSGNDRGRRPSEQGRQVSTGPRKFANLAAFSQHVRQPGMGGQAGAMLCHGGLNPAVALEATQAVAANAWRSPCAARGEAPSHGSLFPSPSTPEGPLEAQREADRPPAALVDLRPVVVAVFRRRPEP